VSEGVETPDQLQANAPACLSAFFKNIYLSHYSDVRVLKFNSD